MIGNRSEFPAGPSTSTIIPDWFARGRRQRELKSIAAATRSVDVRPFNPPRPWKRVIVWLAGAVSLGYGLSLVLHLAMLAAFAIVPWIVDRGGPTLSTELGATEDGSENLLDTRSFDVSTGMTGVETPVAVVEPLPIELTEPELQVASAIAPAVQGVADGDGQSDSSSEGAGHDATFELPKGGNVVHQGSFAAWTVPADPRVGQDYQIVVEVEIPSHTQQYGRSDLTGQLVGTDGYRVMIPDGREYNGLGWVRPRRQPAFRRSGNKARIVFFVRGSQSALVRDTIQIRSRLLNEHQSMQIVF